MRQVLLFVAGAALSAEGRLQVALGATTCTEATLTDANKEGKCPDRKKPQFNAGHNGGQTCPGTTGPECKAANCCIPAACEAANDLVNAVENKCDADNVRKFDNATMSGCGAKTDADCTVEKCCTDISPTCKALGVAANKVHPEWKDVITGTGEKMAATCKAPWAKPWAEYLMCLEVGAATDIGVTTHKDQLTVEKQKILKAIQGDGDRVTELKENVPKIVAFTAECAKDIKNSEEYKAAEKWWNGKDDKNDGSCASC